MAEEKNGGSGHEWLREELLIVLDLYLRHAPRIPRMRSAEIENACDLMNRLRAMLGRKGRRAPATIDMRIKQFLNADPNASNTGLRGGKATREVWALYAHRPDELAAVVARIRAAVEAKTPLPAFAEEEDEDCVAAEGRLLTRLHRFRDRDQKTAAEKKKKVFAASGALRCEACTFDFSETYGALGEGFIECHHITPLSEAPTAGVKTRPEDLALLCANCHRMIHRAKPWLSVEALKALLEQERLANSG